MFEALMAKFGQYDYCVWRMEIGGGTGLFRFRCYHDGGWLEGYATDYVIYWGA